MNASACGLIILSLILPARAWSDCEARSGARTTALVELYTSEGCSSCPPADQQLSQLAAASPGFDHVVPLALHVDYWDYIGWKDPFAKPAFAERQRWLVRSNGHQTVYTPHFFASGAEVRSWPQGLEQAMARINARPARATLAIHATSPARGLLRIDASASAADANSPLDLYLAVTESRLTTRVKAGENQGSTLVHDQVVREWIGPIALSGGQATTRKDVTLPAGWVGENIGVVGFVQNPASGEVLQAVGAKHCPSS